MKSYRSTFWSRNTIVSSFVRGADFATDNDFCVLFDAEKLNKMEHTSLKRCSTACVVVSSSQIYYKITTTRYEDFFYSVYFTSKIIA